MEEYSVLDLFNKNMSQEYLEDYLSQVFISVQEFIINRHKGFLLNELTKNYSELIKIRSNNFFEDREKRDYYLLGMLITIIKLSNRIEDEYKIEKQSLELIAKYKYLSNFICFLNDQLITKAADICQHLNISRSTLNRFIAQIEPYGFVDVKKYGHFNYYYETHEATHLYKIISKIK